MGVFLSERCTARRGLRVEAAKLFEAYRWFCMDQGLKPLTRPSFKKAIHRKGYEQRRTGSGYVWDGLALTADERVEAA